MAHPHAVDSTAGKTILSSAELARVVDRIAHQILEKTEGARNCALLGIPTRGVPLAKRLAARIRAFEGIDVPVGALDITLYRDDLRLRATRAVGRTDLPPDGIDARCVVLVDDVLFSGRTSGPPSTRSRTSAGRVPCSSRSSSTGATGSCRSGPTTSARTSPPR